MQSMEPFWRAANLCRHQTTYAHWRQMLGDRLRIFEHLLLATDQIGSHVPDAASRWSWWQVEVRDRQSVYAIDEETSEARTIPRRDAVVFQVHWPLIYRSICRSLDWRFDHRVLRDVDGLSQIAVDRYPVYLARGSYIASVTYLAVQTNAPFVILRACHREPDAQSRLLLQSRQAIELSLSQCTQLGSSGEISLNDHGHQKLEGFRNQHRPPAESADDPLLIDVPDGTTWASVRIRFVDYETIRVNAAGRSGIFHYTQLGMANSRNAKPVKQWHLLQTYAENRGVLTWRDSGAAANVKKQTQELNKKLVASLRIEGTPIQYDKSIKGYRTVFAIDDDS